MTINRCPFTGEPILTTAEVLDAMAVVEREEAAQLHGCDPDAVTDAMLQDYYAVCDSEMRELARAEGWGP